MTKSNLIRAKDAGHAFLTTHTGTACGVSAAPYVNDCDFDQAGAILNWLYPNLATPAEKPAGKFIRFDQSQFTEGGAADLSKEGVVYVPPSCSTKGKCRLHIVFHGCEQNIDSVGMTFVEGSGFARWADTNRFVDFGKFPQVSASVLNPKGCWDWWGYTGNNYLTKDAPQTVAIWRMVERLQDEPDAVLRAWGAIVLRDLQEFSDQELIELAASNVGERKKAIAEEILRRRHQLRFEKWFGPKLAGLVSTVVTALIIFRCWFNRC